MTTPRNIYSPRICMHTHADNTEHTNIKYHKYSSQHRALYIHLIYVCILMLIIQRSQISNIRKYFSQQSTHNTDDTYHESKSDKLNILHQICI